MVTVNSQQKGSSVLPSKKAATATSIKPGTCTLSTNKYITLLNLEEANLFLYIIHILSSINDNLSLEENSYFERYN